MDESALHDMNSEHFDICNDPEYGPTFGGGFDSHISDNCERYDAEMIQNCIKNEDKHIDECGVSYCYEAGDEYKG